MNTYVHPRVSPDDYGRNRYPWFNEILGDPTAVALVTPAGITRAPACTVAAP